jgi:hypothetical protein
LRHGVGAALAPVDEVLRRLCMRQPEDVDVVQLQDTDAGTEILAMAECGFCVDGEHESCCPTVGQRPPDRCRSTPMVA